MDESTACPSQSISDPLMHIGVSMRIIAWAGFLCADSLRFSSK